MSFQNSAILSDLHLSLFHPCAKREGKEFVLGQSAYLFTFYVLANQIAGYVNYVLICSGNSSYRDYNSYRRGFG